MTDANSPVQIGSVVPPPVPTQLARKGAENKGLSQLSQLSQQK
jgi:hypothetical protein